MEDRRQAYVRALAQPRPRRGDSLGRRTPSGDSLGALAPVPVATDPRQQAVTPPRQALAGAAAGAAASQVQARRCQQRCRAGPPTKPHSAWMPSGSACVVDREWRMDFAFPCGEEKDMLSVVEHFRRLCADIQVVHAPPSLRSGSVRHADIIQTPPREGSVRHADIIQTPPRYRIIRYCSARRCYLNPAQ